MSYSADSGSGTGPRREPLSKERDLIRWMQDRGSLLLGFSGGVDSTYLAVVAAETLPRSQFLAVIGRSESYPESQWANALSVAGNLGIRVLEVETRELADPRYSANPVNRCYYCKRELWSRLLPIAREHGLAAVVDGSNADDLGDHRPGRQAADEYGVMSPLAALGFSKDDVRERLRARGISSSSAPASPCLSSRIPYGVAVLPERLQQIERAESALREVGIVGNVRVRYQGELARVEFDADVLARCSDAEFRRRVAAAVRSAGFANAAIDLRGFRSGSLNVLAAVVSA